MKAYSVAFCYSDYCRRRYEDWFEAPILNSGDSLFVCWARPMLKFAGGVS